MKLGECLQNRKVVLHPNARSTRCFFCLFPQIPFRSHPSPEFGGRAWVGAPRNGFALDNENRNY
jgi:hypothetical protein